MPLAPRLLQTSLLSLLLWTTQTVLPAVALSQSLPPSLPRASSRQLVEEARQRLLDQDERQNSDPLPDGEFDPNDATPEAENIGFDDYLLGPGDSIYVNVLRFSDLSFQSTLDLQGNIVVPLVGAMHLQGLTTVQAREQIRVALDRYVVNPQVDVILIAQRSVQVTVLGEVVKPGLYPLQAPELSAALVSAGGVTRLADLRTVRIRRSLDHGSMVEREVDLYSPLRDAAQVPEVRLEDGDTIVIPTLTAEGSDYDRNLIARTTLAQSQITVRVLNYANSGGGRIGNVALPNGSSFVDALTAISPDLSSANMRSVALVRFDVNQGKAVTQRLNGKKALMGDMSQNPILEQNDVIVVGRNLVAQVTYFLNTFTQPFRDVLGFLLFFDSLTDSAGNLFRPSGTGR